MLKLFELVIKAPYLAREFEVEVVVGSDLYWVSVSLTCVPREILYWNIRKIG